MAASLAQGFGDGFALQPVQSQTSAGSRYRHWSLFPAGEVFGTDLISPGIDHGGGHDVAQLPDVSRPVIAVHHLHSFGGKYRPLAMLPDEILGQRGDVFFALAQW